MPPALDTVVWCRKRLYRRSRRRAMAGREKLSQNPGLTSDRVTRGGPDAAASGCQRHERSGVRGQTPGEKQSFERMGHILPLVASRPGRITSGPPTRRYKHVPGVKHAFRGFPMLRAEARSPVDHVYCHSISLCPIISRLFDGATGRCNGLNGHRSFNSRGAVAGEWSERFFLINYFKD